MRWKLALFAPVAALLLPLGATPALHAAVGCTNSWINTGGGSWFTPSNWSSGSVPVSTDDVCITLNGRYTVQANGTNVTVDSVTLGGTSGAQTL